MGNRSRSGVARGERDAQSARDARRIRRFRLRVGQHLQLPVPAHAPLRPRPGDLRRRRRPPCFALRCARREQRPAGRGQPGVEARRRARGRRADDAARKLRRGAAVRRRREHREFDARDGLHDAEDTGRQRLPRRGARACAHAPVRARLRQQRPLVRAVLAARLIADDARSRRLRGRSRAGRRLHRCARHARRQARLAARASRPAFHMPAFRGFRRWARHCAALAVGRAPAARRRRPRRPRRTAPSSLRGSSGHDLSHPTRSAHRGALAPLRCRGPGRGPRPRERQGRAPT